MPARRGRRPAPCCRLLDGGPNGFHHHRRAVDYPQAAEVARVVGRGIPPFLEKPAHLVQPALPVEELG